MLKGKVVKVLTNEKVVINIGSESNAKMDMKFLVYEIGEDLHDPDTKNFLGKLEIIKGKGKIVYLQNRWATIETYEYEENTKKIVHSPDILRALSLGGITESYERIKKHFEGVKPGDLVREI